MPNQSARGWLGHATLVAAAAWLCAWTLVLTPTSASASCMGFSSPKMIADGIRANGGLVFEGVVRQRWFTTALVEVQRTWQGRTPGHFVAVGPCQGDECRVRDMKIGRSYLFWVSREGGPMYSLGCDAPFDADPAVIELLGSSEAGPAFGPLDLLILAGFVWWSAWVLIVPPALIIAIAIVSLLSRRWSTS